MSSVADAVVQIQVASMAALVAVLTSVVSVLQALAFQMSAPVELLTEQYRVVLSVLVLMAALM